MLSDLQEFSLSVCVCVCVCVCDSVLSDSLQPKDCSTLGSSVHEILQAKKKKKKKKLKQTNKKEILQARILE